MLNLWKPWYVSRPGQLFRRLGRALRGTPSAPTTVALPWGYPLEIDPRETIGRAIWTTGLYDLAVSEALFRLTRPGCLCLDVGANVGYMTNLLAFRAGPGGRVFSFEPHPVVGAALARNLAGLARQPGAAPVTLFPVAVSDTSGDGRLVDPTGFDANAGIARLAFDGEPGGAAVRTVRLDDILGGETAEVVKVDVEGHEAAVFRGAEKALAEKRLRHLVFEEHGPPDAPAFRLLAGHGYAVFQLGWRFAGPVLAELSAPRVCKPYEAPNFLATADPDAARAALSAPGWRVLKGKPA